MRERPISDSSPKRGPERSDWCPFWGVGANFLVFGPTTLFVNPSIQGIQGAGDQTSPKLIIG